MAHERRKGLLVMTGRDRDNIAQALRTIYELAHRPVYQPGETIEEAFTRAGATLGRVSGLAMGVLERLETEGRARQARIEMDADDGPAADWRAEAAHALEEDDRS
jgi:hypothetical protein